MEQKWSEKYLLDIPEIDEQHRSFVKMWEREYKNTPPNSDYKKLYSLILKLEDYILNHFETEETIMKASGYEDIEKHIKEHQFFAKKIEEMKIDFQYGNVMLFDKIMMFMKKWFLTHILQTDRKYQKSVLEYLKGQKT